jgi:DNA repair exonuclease SbcCD nuclease subunit
MNTNLNNPYWIILADTQLGYIHWQNPIREKDFYLSFQEQCLKAAEDSNCLGILGLGDLRERTTIQAKSLGGLNRGLKLLADSGKSLLAIMGNHDKTDPSWIKEMHYPSLKDLTNPKVQADNGFDPEKTLALNFTTRSSLYECLKSKDPVKKEIVFLHQSLKEMTTHILQSYDISLNDFEELGFGRLNKCLVFMGDLHNYGDIRKDNIEIAYPGSLEMTDINEGINGLRSTRLASTPHDYRKFVIHYFPNSHTWTPIQISPRPWFRGKAKTQKEAKALETTLEENLKNWTEKGCVLLTVPQKSIDYFRSILSSYPILESRVEQYDPLSDLEEGALYSKSLESSLSWKENKNKLLAIASELGLADSGHELLHLLCQQDGSSHNTKTDVQEAWNKWYGFQEQSEPKEEQK